MQLGLCVTGRRWGLMAVSDWRPGRTGEGSHMEIQASVTCLEPDWRLRVRARVCVQHCYGMKIRALSGLTL